MNINEIEATLGYLEFHLIKFVESVEPHIIDPDVIGQMYEQAYSMLNDFEVTFNTQLLLFQLDSTKSD